MIRASSFLLLLLAGLVIFFGQVPIASAQEASFSVLRNDFSIVPQVCGKEGQGECNACDFAQLINNVFDFLIFGATVVTTFMFLYAGFLLITAGESEDARSTARTVMTNVIVGFVFLLGSWVIVDTIMKAFLKNNGQLEINGSLPTKWGPWNNIICPPGFVPSVGKAPDKGVTLGSVNDGGSTGSTGCSGSSCSSLSGIVACKESSSCSVAPQLAPKLEALDKAMGDSLTVTEACPPTRSHKNACHAACTCVDVREVPDIKKFINEANNLGLNAVYETTSKEKYDELRRQGIGEMNLWLDRCVGGALENGCHISAPHFSVYGN